jgi:hypothetical protein
MIGYAVVTFDGNMPFPGIAAAWPMVGTELFIGVNGGIRSRVANLVATKPLVWIRLISYSLYLWYWPLIVFAQNLYGDLTGRTISAVIIVSFILAYTSYRFIETPFRRRKLIAIRKMVYVSAFAGVLLVAVVAAVRYTSDGFPDRISTEANHYLNVETIGSVENCTNRTIPSQVRNDQLCPLDASGQSPTVLLWGDSHAGGLASMFDSLGKGHDAAVLMAEHLACPPILGVIRRTRSSCDEFNEEVLEAVVRLGIRDVILSANWSFYVESNSTANLLSESANFSENSSQSKTVFDSLFIPSVKAIRDKGMRLWIVSQVPAYEFSVPQRLAIISWRGGDVESLKMPISEYREQTESWTNTSMTSGRAV